MILKIMEIDTRTHKVHSHFGSDEYYRYYVKNGGILPRGLFGEILREMNLKIADKILDGYSFKMPARMGVLCVTKSKAFLNYEDGEVKTNRPIDFKSTLDLWEKNPEAKAQKKLVRFLNKHTNDYIYRIYFNRFFATFKNKSVYSLQVNRWMKRELAKRIFAGFELDALVEKPVYGDKYK